MSSSTSSSSRASAATLWVAAGVCIALLGASGAWVWMAEGDALAEAGREALVPRERLLRDVSRPRRGGPMVLVLGDSTLRPPRTWTKRLERRLPGVELRSLWAPGLGPPEHLLLLGPALAHRPEVVVLLAHFRMWNAGAPLWQPDLLTLLPPRALPRALALPFHAHGVGAGRLGLASLWGAWGSERLLEAFTGGRERAREAPLLRWLTPMRRRLRGPVQVGTRRERAGLYGDRLYPGHPDLAFLEASVAWAVRRGSRAFVLVSPVPVQRFAVQGKLDEADFPARVALVRSVTERAGGELLDLHAALAADQFADALGHMNEAGAERVATLVGPPLRSALADALREGR